MCVCVFSYWIYARVDGKVQMAFAPSPERLLFRIALHAATNALLLAPSSLAVHVPSVGVAGWPPTVEGLHVAVGGGVTVVLPS